MHIHPLRAKRSERFECFGGTLDSRLAQTPYGRGKRQVGRGVADNTHPGGLYDGAHLRHIEVVEVCFWPFYCQVKKIEAMIHRPAQFGAGVQAGVVHKSYLHTSILPGICHSSVSKQSFTISVYGIYTVYAILGALL